MYSTNVYYYIPRQDVVLYVGSSPRSYQAVYAKPLKLHKGVDNRIQFRFINQEQKPVDVTGKTITCKIIDYKGVEILASISLVSTTPSLDQTGILELRVTSDIVSQFDSQKCYYSLEIPVGDFDLPVFVDSNAGARGVIEICDSVYPAHVPSTTVTLPTHVEPSNNIPVTINSSVYTNTRSPSATIQTYFTNFVGNVTVQGSTSMDVDFYDIQTYQYGIVDDVVTPFTDTDGYTVTGFHPFLRLNISYSQGTLDNIIAR